MKQLLIAALGAAIAMQAFAADEALRRRGTRTGTSSAGPRRMQPGSMP